MFLAHGHRFTNRGRARCMKEIIFCYGPCIRVSLKIRRLKLRRPCKKKLTSELGFRRVQTVAAIAWLVARRSCTRGKIEMRPHGFTLSTDFYCISIRILCAFSHSQIHQVLSEQFPSCGVSRIINMCITESTHAMHSSKRPRYCAGDEVEASE